MQLREGERECVKPASARKPETGLRMDRASDSKILNGTGLVESAGSRWFHAQNTRMRFFSAWFSVCDTLENPLHNSITSIAKKTEGLTALNAGVKHEHVTQRCPCAVKAHFYVLLGNAEHFGGLGRTHSFHFAQHENGAVGVRKFVNQFLQQNADLCGGRLLLRIRNP